MFSYSSNKKVRSQLTLCKLTPKNHKLIELAAAWIDEEWGHVIPKGTNKQDLVRGLTEVPHFFYMFKYDDLPVGMCALRSKGMKTFELDYVYLDKRVRGLGVAGQIVERAKMEAKSAGADMIVFDTLDPGLNRFYISHGAKVVCENQHYGHPAEKLRIML